MTNLLKGYFWARIFLINTMSIFLFGGLILSTAAEASKDPRTKNFREILKGKNESSMELYF